MYPLFATIWYWAAAKYIPVLSDVIAFQNPIGADVFVHVLTGVGTAVGEVVGGGVGNGIIIT